MDTFTHALSGALLARATQPALGGADTLAPRTRLAVGFWAAAFPDSDFIVAFVDRLTYITTHRGVTHSVLLLPLWAAGLALVFRWIYRGRYPWRSFVGVCALGLAIHIAGDVITSYGTTIFAPLSDWRAQLSVTFIIDPYFTAIIGAGLLASWRWWQSRAAAVAALAVLVAYVGWQAYLQDRAEAVGRAYVAANRLEHARVHALAQPFSPFNWLIVVEQPQRYYLSYISLSRRSPSTPPPGAGMLRRVYDSYRPSGGARWRAVARFGEAPRDADIAKTMWQSPVFTGYRRFAMFPAAYRVERLAAKTCVEFTDLRFALVARRAPFRYGACRDNGTTTWKITPIDSLDRP